MAVMHLEYFFQAEDGIRDRSPSRGLGDVYKRQVQMNKAEFISAIAEAAGSSKSDATAHVEAMINVVTNTLKSDDQVTLVGFGTFLAKKRDARTGRNPRTGETIQIKASTVPAFKAGKAFKDALN